MKQMKSLFYISVIPSLLIMMLSGTVYGASVTLQGEGALQNGQGSGSTVSKNDVNRDGNQLILAPQKLKNRSDSGMESETGSQSVRMERYKSYKEGEGERKIR
jgi:K+-transporting ATPase c subunit